MSAPPEEDWDTRLRQITAAQWMQAIAWRGVMRLLPALPDPSPAFALADATMRLLYATIFRLDRDYRRRLGSEASEAAMQVALAADSLAKQVERLYRRSKESLGVAEIVESLFMMFASSTTTAPALAYEEVHKLHGACAKFTPILVEAWENELVADLEALEPLDREELDNLQEFLVRPLWRVSMAEPSEIAKATRKWLEAMRETGSEAVAASAGLLSHYERHLNRGLDWTGVCTVILDRERRRLSPDEAVALQRIANDPVRLATLLAKAALDDRARLKLTTDPSAAGFRNAFPEFAFDPASLVELDRRLEGSHRDFAPHPLWLAWIQTGRRSGLEAIQAEIRLHLSQSDGARPTLESSNAEPALAPRPVRKTVRHSIKKR
jgi:hypothetical protein